MKKYVLILSNNLRIYVHKNNIIHLYHLIETIAIYFILLDQYYNFSKGIRKF